MLKYVVTGTARSGTKYAATLLTNAGMKCGHESVFNSWGSNFTRAPKWREQETHLGDSSFITAPFIPEVKGDLKVVHLIRPPLDVIRSIVGIAHVGNNRAPWVQFLNAHINLTQFPPGPQRAAAYWVRWNRLIQDNGPDVTWDVTKITSDHILELALMTGIEIDPADAVSAVDSTDRRINHRERADWVTVDHLGRMRGEVLAMAERLGIPLESPKLQGANPEIAIVDEVQDWKADGGEAKDAVTVSLRPAETTGPFDHNVAAISGDLMLSHLGAGWYEVIDTSTNEVLDKVRGKESAEARMAELKVAEST